MKLTTYISALLLSVSTIFAQTQTPDAAKALQNFNAGDFAAALPQYAALWQQYGRDPKYNFYYGACLVETNQQIPLATRCLKFAALRNYNKESFFYVARANQLSYEFEEALNNFTKYAKLPGVSATLKERALQYADQCKTGISMSPKIYNTTVLSADTLPVSTEIDALRFSTELGRLAKNSEYFESGIDPNGILFVTERCDRVFYAATAPNSDQTDILYMEKLIDGWSKPVDIGSEVNSPSDEKYPILLTDGITLYFSSNRPGGLGGWDIYKAIYSTETKLFGDVANLGIPFNSPNDDYLFVPDDFAKKAWFASNRATSNDKTVVYQIKWDETVVKSNVPDINYVKEAACLKRTSGGPESLANSSPDGNHSKSGQIKSSFTFSVADTLEYTQLEHFRSTEALSEFKKGRALALKKDSLTSLMKEKRARYSSTNSETERNNMVNDILRLEKETYSIDAATGPFYFKAQRLEQEKIKELVRTGQYTPLSGTKSEPKKIVSFNVADIPHDLTLYSADEFGHQLQALQAIYPRLFDEQKSYQLKQADSLYAWGNLLNIESSRMLEKAVQTPAQTEVAMPRPFKNDDNPTVATEQLVQQSRDTKYKALMLYHQALDIKLAIYQGKYAELKNLSPQYPAISNHNGEAYSLGKEAKDMMEQAEQTGNMETFEKAGALKRKAVETQEKGFFKYLDMLDKNPEKVGAPVKEEQKTFALPSYSEMHKNEGPVTETSNTKTSQPKQNGAEPLSTTSAQTSKTMVAEPAESVVYKIQIGVFRNRPDENTLNKLENVTTDFLADSGLTKYYCGKFTSYDQAAAALPNVKAAGFTGAFVSAFLNGKPITVQQARVLQQKN